jgi:muramoyltetrapeptide carboxypeptidase
MITGNWEVRHFEVAMSSLYPPLPANAPVGIIYPSSPATAERVQSGLSIIANWGYSPRLFHPLGSPADFLAADDVHRGAAVQRAIGDASLPLVWAARGGYGVVRLLPLLDFSARKKPPVLMGFSDISLLLDHAAHRFGWPAVHCPNVTTLTTLDEDSRNALRHFLATGSFCPLEGLTPVRSGLVSGPLVPMNLTLLLSVVGTPFEVNLDGTILLLEEVGEPPYRVDRMLQQLGLLPSARNLRGVVLGDLADTGTNPVVRETVERLAATLDVPCCTGASVGHGASNWPLPVRARATLDATAGSLTLGPF